jgi:hypothetical protein
VPIDEQIEVRLARERREQVIVALPGTVAHPGGRQVVEAPQQGGDRAMLDGVPLAHDRPRFSIDRHGFSAHPLGPLPPRRRSRDTPP